MSASGSVPTTSTFWPPRNNNVDPVVSPRRFASDSDKMPWPGRRFWTSWRSGSGRNAANVGSTPVTSIGIMNGGSGWSTPSPFSSSDAVIHAMSAVAVVVAVTSGTVLTRSPNPAGRPPGTHVSHASGVGTAAKLPEEDGVDDAGAVGPASLRPPSQTMVEPISATPTNVTRPRVSARRSSASMTVGESTGVPRRVRERSARGGVLQETGEPLGPAGSLARPAGVHGDSDRTELALHRRRDARGASAYERVELGDCVVQAMQHLPRSDDIVAVALERDDISHGFHHRTEVRHGVIGRGAHATRTLVTGARRGATVNQERPASVDPNTSPEVAPKNRLRTSPSPSRARACRRMVT